MQNQPFDVSEFCGEKAVELFENAAILRALEALAFENDNLEAGDHCLTEVQLLARACRRNIEAIATSLGDLQTPKEIPTRADRREKQENT